MPGVPFEIPSETVIVLNTMLFAPAASAPAAASRASASMCILHGVSMLQVDAIPTCGFAKSSSVNPTARSIARPGALGAPSTTTRELSRGSTPPGGLRSSLAMKFRRLPRYFKGRDYGVRVTPEQPAARVSSRFAGKHLALIGMRRRGLAGFDRLLLHESRRV